MLASFEQGDQANEAVARLAERVEQSFVEFGVRSRGRGREDRLRPLAEEIYKSTAGYVAGAITIATIAGVSAFFVLSILGTPFAVPLAVLMFFLDLVPLVTHDLGERLVHALVPEIAIE